LLARIITKPRTVCFCHTVVVTIAGSVALLERFIIAMTSAFLLLALLAPFRALSRRLLLGGDCFDLPLAGAKSQRWLRSVWRKAR
jgi:hypothetical protein